MAHYPPGRGEIEISEHYPLPDFLGTWEIFEKFPAGSLLHDHVKEYVGNMKEYVRNMKKYTYEKYEGIYSKYEEICRKYERT